MSDEEKSKSLTTGFTTVAETRRKEDVHELVYADTKLLIPTLAIVCLAAIGLILSFL